MEKGKEEEKYKEKDKEKRREGVLREIVLT
jgi:hypothetical protein